MLLSIFYQIGFDTDHQLKMSFLLQELDMAYQLYIQSYMYENKNNIYMKVGWP
jgi:hypothetical protein